MATGPTAYTPSPELREAIDHFIATGEALKDAKARLRKAVAHDLKQPPEPTSNEVAAFLPWSDETVRGIAREYDVPLKRNPTVKSIKPAKRPARKPAG